MAAQSRFGADTLFLGTQHNMNPQEAKRLSEMLASRLGEVVANVTPAMLGQPTTLAEILLMGFTTTAAFQTAFPPEGGFHVSQELITGMAAYPANKSVLTDLLYKGILNSDEDPSKLEYAIETVSAGRIIPEFRAEMSAVFDQLFPVPTGRPKKITQNEFESLVKRSELLRPFFPKFLRLAKEYPNRPSLDLLGFLAPEFPNAVVYLSSRIDQLDRIRSGYQGKVITRASADVFADRMAAADWDIAPKYALQKVREARRMLLGKSRIRSPRLPDTSNLDLH
jgi:hypothetical protein